MVAPRIAVLRAPGTNCDYETAYAFEICGGKPERLHLLQLLEDPQRLAEFQILCIPGGFSYGDDVGAGSILGNHLRNRLVGVLNEFLQADKLCLGICNGFQVLMKAGVLPSGTVTPDAEPEATLTWNDNGRYTARWVHTRTAGSNSVFLRGIDRLDLPIAHAEGRIVVRNPEVLEKWRAQKQLSLCYATPCGANETASACDLTAAELAYPVNPNGSTANLAGLSDPTGRVLGLMPHPERFLFRTQHPQWTRLDLPEQGGGRQVFQNAIDYFAN